MGVKVYNKVATFLASGAMMFSLVGCNNNDNVIDSSSKVNTNVTTGEISTSDGETISTTTSLFTSTNTTMQESMTDSTTNLITTSTSDVCTENDQVVFDYFNVLSDSIKDNINSEELLEKGKAYFVYCVDFIFYDGEIKGIKFSDMSDMARQQLLSDITMIDSLICSKYPNYKETISEGSGELYKKASEIIRSGSQNISNFSKDKLGEANYYKLMEYKDLFMETAFGDFDVFEDVIDQGFEKVKEWYEGLR